MLFFVFLTVFDEYLWYLDGNIISNHKSVVRMRSLERGMVIDELGLGKVWVNVGRVYT